MKKIKKYLIIALVILFVILVASIAGWIFLSKFFIDSKNIQIENTQELTPIKNNNDTTTIYGVTMRNVCFDKFEDFVKNYSSDYSKCLVDFNFDQGLCSGFNLEEEGLADINVVIILDASGSMAETVGGQSKMNIAKKAVSNFLINMPRGVNTGLIVYGHMGSGGYSGKDISCLGIEEVVKLGTNNSSNIISAVNSFQPKGWTPISKSFDFAKNIFVEKGVKKKNYLVLVSDGIESCDGDPLTSATNLKLGVKDIKLNVIGFTADTTTQDFLKNIATNGGGTYLTADNSSSMTKAFNDQLLIIKKECLRMSVAKSALANKANNFNNLDCWLAEYKKEVDNLNKVASSDPINTYCNIEISNVLSARNTEFWYKKQALEEQNNFIYEKIKLELSGQLQYLNSLKK
ncbi:MAG: VWA domain-containing protein [Candidatus Staskawiczbacteria bacterium]|jgi:hypothetical protein